MGHMWATHVSALRLLSEHDSLLVCRWAGPCDLTALISLFLALAGIG